MTTLPPIHNTRSPQQWQIIKGSGIYIPDSIIIDLGCGYGDIFFRCALSGAAQVTGYEANPSVFSNLSHRHHNFLIDLFEASPEGNSQLIENSQKFIIHNKPISEVDWKPVNVAICFSVLPYLGGEATNVLKLMCKYSDISLIECQYFGDGPGPREVKNDADMKQWLNGTGWGNIEKIGQTFISGRDKFRSIWRCDK